MTIIFTRSNKQSILHFQLYHETIKIENQLKELTTYKIIIFFTHNNKQSILHSQLYHETIKIENQLKKLTT